MAILDDLVQALQGKKTPQQISLLVQQLQREKELYEAFKSTGLSITSIDDIQARSRDRLGILTKVEKIDLIDLIQKINEIATIALINRITLIDEIAKVGNMTLVSQIDRLNPILPTPYFIDSFKTGNFSLWDGTTGSPTVATDKGYTDTYSEKIDNMDIWWTYGAKKDLQAELVGVTKFYIYGYVWISAFSPLNNNDMVIILGTQRNGAGYGYGSMGYTFAVRRVSGVNKIGIWNDNDFVFVDSGLALSSYLNQWIYVKLEVNVHATLGSVKLYINDVLACTANGATDTSLQQTIWSGASGNEGGTGQGNISLWIDDVLVDNGIGFDAVIDKSVCWGNLDILQQRPTSLDLYAQLRHAGVEIDPRAIRALTLSDVVTATQATRTSLKTQPEREDLSIYAIEASPAGSGYTELISAVSGQKIKVYSIGYEIATDIDVSFRFASGSQWCRRVTAGVMVQTFVNPMVGGASQALNLYTSGACTVKGHVQYAQEA